MKMTKVFLVMAGLLSASSSFAVCDVGTELMLARSTVIREEGKLGLSPYIAGIYVADAAEGVYGVVIRPGQKANMEWTDFVTIVRCEVVATKIR